MRTYTKIPENTFSEIQENAGVLLRNFTPTSPSISTSDIIGATSGGIEFSDEPDFEDYGDDIDNCPKNTKELKRITGREITLGGTFVTVNKTLIADLMAGGTVASNKITASDTIDDDAYKDLWWITDYGTSGFIAIHVKNALNTGGFKFKSDDRAKGQFDFEFTAHYTIEDQDDVPYEVYVQDTASTTD